MALIGLANAMTTSLSFPLYTDLMPRHRLGEFTGFAAFITSLSQALGAVLVGGFVDLTGSYRIVFVTAGLLIAVSLVLLQRVHPEEVFPEGPEGLLAYPERPFEGSSLA